MLDNNFFRVLVYNLFWNFDQKICPKIFFLKILAKFVVLLSSQIFGPKSGQIFLSQHWSQMMVLNLVKISFKKWVQIVGSEFGPILCPKISPKL